MRQITARRRYSYPISTVLLVEECPVCGVIYGLPKDFNDARYRNGGSVWCPNGDRLGWNQTDADRQRERAEAAEKRAASAERAARYQREEAARERRTASALRGQPDTHEEPDSEWGLSGPGMPSCGFPERHAPHRNPTPRLASRSCRRAGSTSERLEGGRVTRLVIGRSGEFISWTWRYKRPVPFKRNARRYGR